MHFYTLQTIVLLIIQLEFYRQSLLVVVQHYANMET